MVQVKVARQMFKKKRDNLLDGAGYFATLQKMEDEQSVNNEMYSSTFKIKTDIAPK